MRIVARRTERLLPLSALPRVRTSREPLVVWRTWLVAPEHRRGVGVVPMLTGLFGFPWRNRTLDAKCTIQEPDRGDVALWRGTVDRHHRLIPDPDCTCGIYASRAALEGPPLELVPRGRPIVTGFVELSGHILEDDTSLRAGRARIVGPLHVLPGRIPLPDLLARNVGLARAPRAVVVERDGYQVRWSGRGAPLEAWRRDVARQLQHRYGVTVA